MRTSALARLVNYCAVQVTQPERTRNMQTVRSRAVGPKSVSSDRRNRRRLRELCDEVLASYRIASDRDVITESDRADARQVLASIAPLGLSR
jgi:hypothetical protein